VLQPPPATGLKSNWNGVPVPFFSNASYSCAKSTTFFLSDRNLEAWNLTCLPGGVWQTPVWPFCVTSMTSTSRSKQGVDFQTSVRGRKGKEGKVFLCENTRKINFSCKKQTTRRLLFSEDNCTNHSVLGLSPKKFFYGTCYIFEENVCGNVLFLLCMLKVPQMFTKSVIVFTNVIFFNGFQDKEKNI
jgi:hypothetical protein